MATRAEKRRLERDLRYRVRASTSANIMAQVHFNNDKNKRMRGEKHRQVES